MEEGSPVYWDSLIDDSPRSTAASCHRILPGQLKPPRPRKYVNLPYGKPPYKIPYVICGRTLKTPACDGSGNVLQRSRSATLNVARKRTIVHAQRISRIMFCGRTCYTICSTFTELYANVLENFRHCTKMFLSH